MFDGRFVGHDPSRCYDQPDIEGIETEQRRRDDVEHQGSCYGEPDIEGIETTTRQPRPQKKSMVATASPTSRLLGDGDVATLPVMGAGNIAGALRAMKYGSTVEVIDEVLAGNPAATVADVRAYAAARAAEATAEMDAAEARVQRGVCRHRDQEIVLGDDGTWYHGRMPFAWGSRGCRSWSFSRLGEWDESLSRTSKAAPVPDADGPSRDRP